MMHHTRHASLADLVVVARSASRPDREIAFAEIVRRFRPNAQARAFHLLHDSQLAQDVAQDAFLDAYQGLDQLREPAAFPGWFRRIVFKHADRIRRRSQSLFDELGSAQAEADEAVSPEAWVTARENIARVRELLPELAEHERGVIVLFYFGHRSHAEIGECLDVPVSTVKKRLHDARRRLRLLLDAADEGHTRERSRGALARRAPMLRGDRARRLAALSTKESRAVLSRFAPEEVAAALRELPAKEQVAFLEVADRLPEIVPCLPEVTLTHTLRLVGLEEAGWLVEFASPEQRVAAVDLDCWQDGRLSPSRVFEWIDTLIEAGTETLIAAFDELDTELWILALQWMADFVIPGHGDGTSDPADDPEEDRRLEDGSTVDGIVFYRVTHPDHEERLHTILDTAQHYTPTLYWDFAYGAVLEPPKSCEDVAAHWHAGRLSDLGFPDLEKAMALYKPLVVEAVPVVASLTPPPAESTPVPAVLSGTSLGRALAELPVDRASDIEAQLMTLANAIAVADRLPLSEAQALDYSVRKGVEGVDRGLVALATAHRRSLADVADTTPTRDLFRLGVSLCDELRPKKTLGELEAREDAEVGSDWDLYEEWLSEADQTLRSDGTLAR